MASVIGLRLIVSAFEPVAFTTIGAVPVREKVEEEPGQAVRQSEPTQTVGAPTELCALRFPKASRLRTGAVGVAWSSAANKPKVAEGVAVPFPEGTTEEMKAKLCAAPPASATDES